MASNTAVADSAQTTSLLDQIVDDKAVVKLRFNLTPDQILSLAGSLIERSRAVYDAVAKAVDNPTWETTLGALAEDDARFSVVESMCTFPKDVSSDKAIRNAATEAASKLSAYGVEAGSRHDVYLAVQAFDKTGKAKDPPAEAQRFLERTLRNFKRKGLHLEAEKRDKVKELNTRLSELGIQFQKNLGEENTKLYFAREELAGLPDSYFEGRETRSEDGKFEVTLKYPDYYPVMKLCKVAATRKAVATAYDSQCLEENTAILEEMVSLRHQMAMLLGYPSHAAFIAETRMAKSPKTILDFLSDLSAKLDPLFDKEMQVLLKLKADECKESGEEFDGALNQWDVTYFRNMVEEKQYDVDHEAIKQFFPTDVVTKGLLGIYQELLGLTFELDEQLSAAAWHEEVRAYRVLDSDSGELVGVFYLDLHPRDGKYGHAACFGLQPSCRAAFSDTGRIIPVAACVCNFPKATPTKPSLLPHSDVVTFFHEFGHVMHQLCSLADYAMFAGTAVERDFVEAPSQMLENWVWEEAALSRMSGNVNDRTQPLPSAIIDKLVKAKNANAGIVNKRQLLFGFFDQFIHTQDKVDTAKEMARLMREIMKTDPIEGTNFAAHFGHLAGGYDAQYYGYMWAEVFSMDMFQSRFKAAGIFNQEVGKAYREHILKPGGSRDAIDSLKAFLGREPSSEPFLRSKGLAVAA
ncbi:hypothetical protein WJX72_004381 [[Myrmecia] bisecta]|uniref:Peptidase M3A/M3B catalytic domain-containing protein n=1 Tax=[Myrmecia] bisecta TaxID=41462 RepID=A0AAW1Q731_9CHLO